MMVLKENTVSTSLNIPAQISEWIAFLSAYGVLKKITLRFGITGDWLERRRCWAPLACEEDTVPLFALWPWRAGCQAQICCKAPLSGPYALSSPCPTPMCHYGTGVVHGVSSEGAGSPPCAGALRQVSWALPSPAPSLPPPRHFAPPQNLCSTARVAPLRI